MDSDVMVEPGRARLDREEARVRRDLERAETKASLVVQGASVLLPVLLAGAALAHVPPAATVLALAAAAVDVGAVVLAVLVVWARLGRGTGWPARAGMRGEELLAHLAAHDEDQEQAEQLGYLSGLAAAKLRLTNGAIVAFLLAVVTLLAAGTAAAVLR
jgi:hypothetical protein